MCLCPKSSGIKTAINGKYRKATCEQTEESYE
jgi:hypothetical protein